MFLHSLILFVILCASVHGTDSKVSKDSLSDKYFMMAREVDTWTDALGLPIDPKIKSLVVALNVLGVKTTASCEGHLEWGCASPWVDLNLRSPQYLSLRQKIFANQNTIDNISANGGLEAEAKTKAVELLLTEQSALFKDLDKVQAADQQVIQSFLNAFYQHHFTSYDRILFLESVSSDHRLESHGAQFQCLRTPEERAKKLMEYQDEMALFERFLKSKID